MNLDSLVAIEWLYVAITGKAETQQIGDQGHQEWVQKHPFRLLPGIFLCYITIYHNYVMK